MMENAEEVPTVDAVSVQLQFDERAARPGPKPPRLATDMEWVDLAKVIVSTQVHESGEED